MADVDKYVDEIDQLTADQGCLGDEHDRWRSSVAAIIRRAQVDARTATWRREADTISNAGGGEQVTVDPSGSDSAAPSSGPAPAPAEELDAIADRGKEILDMFEEAFSAWYDAACSEDYGRTQALMETATQKHVAAMHALRCAYAGASEPRGCPTPGACSCPPSEAAELARLRKLFDDAGQGEHNVLALVDYYQRLSIEADDELARLRKLFNDAGSPECDVLRLVEFCQAEILRLRAEVKRLREADASLRAAVKRHEKRSDMVKREKLGHRLKRVRIARDLSLRETATKVGVSPTYLSRVENCLDPSPPTEKTLRALAEALGDNVDELMQLAGRVPEDVEKLIKADPDMPVMLRRAREQNVTGAEFLKWLETRTVSFGRNDKLSTEPHRALADVPTRQLLKQVRTLGVTGTASVHGCSERDVRSELSRRLRARATAKATDLSWLLQRMGDYMRMQIILAMRKPGS